MNQVNKRIKNIRKQKKITQAHIAGHLGITTRAYSKIESGETNLTIDRLYKITNLFDIDPVVLFDKNTDSGINYKSSETIINNTSSISLVKHYQETIMLLKEQNEFLKKFLTKES